VSVIGYLVQCQTCGARMLVTAEADHLDRPITGEI